MGTHYLKQLMLTWKLREPALQAAVEAFGPDPGSRGLDVGCGSGLLCMELARAVGAQGHVTGVDISVDHLEQGQTLVADAGLDQRVSLREASADELPFADDELDWAWSVDCVRYGGWDPVPQLREMCRVVRPGGRVAILAWSSEKLLPGHPELEATLQATKAGISPFSSELPPERHLSRALGLLREGGLQELRARTFAGDVHAPLSATIRRALVLLFDMRWPGIADELSPERFAEFERLCRPGSPDFLPDHPDYYAFFTYSMFEGRVG